MLRCYGYIKEKMPADSRTGIESRIVLRPVYEVKTAGDAAGVRAYCA